MRLDKRDIKILNILQDDGRASYSSIARQLNISEAAVYSRVNRLVREGVVKGFTALLDETKLNLSIGAFIGLRATPSKYAEVLNQLAAFPEVVEIHDVTGDYYAMLKVKTRNKEELAALLDKIGRLDGVVSTDTKLILRTIKETTKIPFSKLEETALPPRQTRIKAKQ
ncbi:MAG: Lrp/AsnC family transcriptional regulator [Nitrososphaerota archaeon]|nr:Lrp/AsnC family transcriptional regulator [Candidatus Calditenuaceae archaeon]MDW8073848.1 Lrp/AsnC family transcriptional regulator [Nitrososphaerota archaeon]